MMYSQCCVTTTSSQFQHPCSLRGTQGVGQPCPWLILLQTRASLMESLGVMLGRFMLPVCSPGLRGGSVAVLQLECCSRLKCRLEFDWEHGYCCSQCRQTSATNPGVQRRSCGVIWNSVYCLFLFSGVGSCSGLVWLQIHSPPASAF